MNTPIAVLVKAVDLAPVVDRVHSTITTDDRRLGFSYADQAACESALVLGERFGVDVHVWSGAQLSAEPQLLLLAASGASAVHRVDVDPALPSHVVAGALATAMADRNYSLVLSGDMSNDRGSGSVPGFVAYQLGVPSVCGVVEIDHDESGAAIRVVRRLDGGRRQHIDISGVAVVSTEGSVANLRRAPLSSLRPSQQPALTVHAAEISENTHHERLCAFVPRTTVVSSPTSPDAFDRVVQLTEAMIEHEPPHRIEAEPDEAAQYIYEQLVRWDYLG